MDESAPAVPETPSIAGSFERIIQNLAAAVKCRRIYPPTHGMVQRTFRRLHEDLRLLFVDQEIVRVGLVGDDLVGGEQPLSRVNLTVQHLIRTLQEREIEKLSFHRGLQEEELARFVEFLSKPSGFLGGWRETEEHLQLLGIQRITVGKIWIQPAEEQVAAPAELGEIYRGSLRVIREIIEGYRAGNRLPISLARDIVHSIVRSIHDDPALLLSLSALKGHDDYTFTHALNVSILTVAQAKVLGLKERDLDAFGLSALLHDIGKQQIPLEILGKPSRLTDEEFEIMKRHPVIGAETLRKISGLPEIALNVAFEHHLGVAFRGYPRVGRKWKLNLCTLLTTIADSYDALRTNRPYRADLSVDQTLEIMRQGVGTLYDSRLFELFERVVRAMAEKERGENAK